MGELRDKLLAEKQGLQQSCAAAPDTACEATTEMQGVEERGTVYGSGAPTHKEVAVSCVQLAHARVQISIPHHYTPVTPPVLSTCAATSVARVLSSVTKCGMKVLSTMCVCVLRAGVTAA